MLVLGAVLLGSAIAGRNWAQSNEVEVQFHAFQDTRSVTVLSRPSISPKTSPTARLFDSTSASMRYPPLPIRASGVIARARTAAGRWAARR
jgi:hypothetical protein